MQLCRHEQLTEHKEHSFFCLSCGIVKILGNGYALGVQVPFLLQPWTGCFLPRPRACCAGQTCSAAFCYVAVIRHRQRRSNLFGCGSFAMGVEPPAELSLDVRRVSHNICGE